MVDGGSQLLPQILWDKLQFRCAYFTLNRTWSPNHSVLVIMGATIYCPVGVKFPEMGYLFRLAGINLKPQNFHPNRPKRLISTLNFNIGATI
jgi:hypothetical protein